MSVRVLFQNTFEEVGTDTPYHDRSLFIDTEYLE